ncbi:hypothetical protein [Luteolibacter sp. LG18]|uniref:hypothetical protein n=1 Tax=Luteolibacter sp. LG18 TaxID=2819286 RepID=UPI0030C71C2F
MKKTTTTLSLDAALLEAARAEAAARGLSFSALLQGWVEEALARTTATAGTHPEPADTDLR